MNAIFGISTSGSSSANSGSSHYTSSSTCRQLFPQPSKRRRLAASTTTTTTTNNNNEKNNRSNRMKTADIQSSLCAVGTTITTHDDATRTSSSNNTSTITAGALSSGGLLANLGNTNNTTIARSKPTTNTTNTDTFKRGEQKRNIIETSVLQQSGTTSTQDNRPVGGNTLSSTSTSTSVRGRRCFGVLGDIGNTTTTTTRNTNHRERERERKQRTTTRNITDNVTKKRNASSCTTSVLGDSILCNPHHLLGQQHKENSLRDRIQTSVLALASSSPPPPPPIPPPVSVLLTTTTGLITQQQQQQQQPVTTTTTTSPVKNRRDKKERRKQTSNAVLQDNGSISNDHKDASFASKEKTKISTITSLDSTTTAWYSCISKPEETDQIKSDLIPIKSTRSKKPKTITSSLVASTVLEEDTDSFATAASTFVKTSKVAQDAYPTRRRSNKKSDPAPSSSPASASPPYSPSSPVEIHDAIEDDEASTMKSNALTVALALKIIRNLNIQANQISTSPILNQKLNEQVSPIGGLKQQLQQQQLKKVVRNPKVDKRKSQKKKMMRQELLRKKTTRDRLLQDKATARSVLQPSNRRRTGNPRPESKDSSIQISDQMDFSIPGRPDRKESQKSEENEGTDAIVLKEAAEILLQLSSFAGITHSDTRGGMHTDLSMANTKQHLLSSQSQDSEDYTRPSIIYTSNDLAEEKENHDANQSSLARHTRRTSCESNNQSTRNQEDDYNTHHSPSPSRRTRRSSRESGRTSRQCHEHERSSCPSGSNSDADHVLSAHNSSTPRRTRRSSRESFGTKSRQPQDSERRSISNNHAEEESTQNSLSPRRRTRRLSRESGPKSRRPQKSEHSTCLSMSKNNAEDEQEESAHDSRSSQRTRRSSREFGAKSKQPIERVAVKHANSTTSKATTTSRRSRTKSCEGNENEGTPTKRSTTMGKGSKSKNSATNDNTISSADIKNSLIVPVRRSARGAIPTDRYVPEVKRRRSKKRSHQIAIEDRREVKTAAISKELRSDEKKHVSKQNIILSSSHDVTSTKRAKRSRAKKTTSHINEVDNSTEDDFFAQCSDSDGNEMQQVSSPLLKSIASPTRAKKTTSHVNEVDNSTEDDFFAQCSDSDGNEIQQVSSPLLKSIASPTKQTDEAEERQRKQPTKKEVLNVKKITEKITSDANTTQSNVSTLDPNDWSATQVSLLRNAYNIVDPCAVDFWDEVAVRVEGKSGDQCKEKWFSLVQTPVPKKASSRKRGTQKENQGSASNKHIVLEEDDIFNATPMKEDMCDGGEEDDDNVHFEVDYGSPIIDQGREDAVNTSEYDDGTTTTAPLSRIGYKSYIQNMRRDISRAGKEKRKTKKQQEKKVGDGLNSHKVLSDSIDHGDIEVNASLTPGGTVRVRTVDWNENDEDDFFDSEDDDNNDEY